VAFDDAILGNDDFDPQAASEELLRRQMGDFPQGSDARGLNTRMLRKLGKAPVPEPVSPSAPLARPPQPPSPDAPLDLSGFEPVTPPAADQPQGQLDLSGFEPVEPEKPKTTEQPSYIKEFVKGVAEGVKGMAASSVKGIAAVVPEAGAQPDYDPMGNAVGTNDAMEKGLVPKPMEERLFYRAGKRIDEFGKETLEAAPGFEGSWTRDIGAGFGSMLAGIPVALIPGVGPLVGGTLYTTAGMGEAVENAVKNKASTSQAESAGIAGSVAGATDLVDVMLPFFGGSTGRALGFIKRVGLAAVKGAVTEAGQEGIQQLMQNAIAMGVYKPDQDLFEDVPRSMAIAAIVGGTVAGGGAALHRDNATSPASPPPGPTSGNLPPPPSGPSGPRSSPEDIADFIRRANETNPNPPPPPGSGPTRPQDPATMTDAELMDAFMDIRPDMHGTLKDVLRRTGYADSTIDAMSHRAQVEEAIGVIRMERAEAQRTAHKTQTSPESSAGPQQEGLKPKAPTPHADYAVLRAYGYTDADIETMSEAQREREVSDAFAEGIKPGEAMKKYPPPSQRDTGTRQQPKVVETADDVQAAQPVEPKSDAQAQAENYKHAHVELPALGLEGKHSVSVETGAGQTRSGTAPDGKQWQVVLKHAYGRIKGTKGADGQPLDIVIGPNPKSQHVFVIDQHEPGKGFDEHKVMSGFDTPQQAIVAYAGMYNDQGVGRIGHVTAMTPDQFREWMASGKTSEPFGPKTPEPSKTSGEVEGSARALTEVGAGTGTSTPKVSPDGAGTVASAGVSEGETTTEPDRSKAEILEPSPLYAEPTARHHDQIEAVLGEDYHRVAEVDIQRAAEILAENEGMEPATAFGQAVAENAVEQGFLTEQEAVQAYGEEVKDVLDAGREGTPERGENAVGEGTAPVEVGTSGAEEAGVVPGSSETGEQADIAETAAAADEAANAEQHDTGRTEPDTASETGGAADEEATGPAEDADKSGEPVKSRLEEHLERARKATEKANAKEEEREKKAFDRLHKKEAEQKLAATEQEEKPDIKDAGEKLGGARKDAWAGRALTYADLEGLNDLEKGKALTKHAVFPPPDWAEVVAGGTDPMAAALMKRIYDRLPVKPNDDRYRGREDTDKAFINALTDLRDIFKKVKTVKDAKDIDANAGVRDSLSWSNRGVIYPAKATSNPLDLGWADEKAARRAVEAGFPNMEPWQRFFEVRQKRNWNPDKKAHEDGAFYVSRKNAGNVGDEYDTRAEAVAFAKEAYSKLSDDRKKDGEEPRRPHLDQVYRDGPDYRSDRNITAEDFIKDFGFRGVEFGNYVASDERQKTVNLAYDALHDLARALNIPAKALSLNGRLGVGFGSRGHGGPFAAHYEPSKRVINMTKVSGAGSLAHEWGHALDHYLGALGGRESNQHSREWVPSISGWRDLPKNLSRFKENNYLWANGNLPPKLRAAINRLMHDMLRVEENDAAFDARMAREIESAKNGQQGWIEHLKRQRAKGARSTKQAETQIEVWGRKIERLQKQRDSGRRNEVATEYFKQAEKLSGGGDYWKRPNELFARAFEAFVHDKIKGEGFESQYLVQGVEPDRFGTGFRGNPYPAGDERKTINADFERVLRAFAVGEGDRLQGAEGEPEPVETVVNVRKPTPQPTAQAEAEAVGGKVTLDEAFQNHFVGGGSFANILQARKFAKEKGFAEDAKSVEEAIELAMVRWARAEIQGVASPKAGYRMLVHMYQQQPKLGTRTSTSVRDQAYSTPIPLGYLAQRLAGITPDTTVYEPTAGNGALLFTATPENVKANEVNGERRENLKSQGYKVHGYDASNVGQFASPKSVDVVIANPPFGVVKEGGQSKTFDLSEVQPNYRTNEIDHAISLRSLAAMKDDGRAVLILGGVNKMVSTKEGRADAYNGKAKREFYLTLYNNYNVTDHFTVNGDLYDRQGAAWPVDVIVIQGRGKSARPLPAVEPPTIFNSWEALGGKLDGSQATGDVRPAGEPAGVTPESGAGLAGRGGGDRSGAGTEQPGPVEPTGVRGQRGTKAADTGPASGAESNVTERSGPGDEPARSGEQPAVDDFDAAFDAALDDAFGKKEEPAAPRQRKQPVFQKWEVVHDSGTVMNSGLRESQAKAFAKEAGDRVMARPERSTSTVAKDTVTTGVKAADEAFSALYDLFGGNKASSGFTFDEDTYRKAKPHFEAAASAFSQFKNNLGELLKRMVAHLRDAMKFTREAMERIKPYLKRFIDDMRAAETPEAPRKEALKGKPTETENQVVYKPRSQVAGLDTLAPVNMAKPMADSLEALEARVGPIDEFVTKELGFKPGELGNYIGAEQVDALGLAIDNIKRGRGFIIGDQTGIGKGRVNALVIRWAIKNGRMPVFVTEKPNLYKDMFRDLMDTGIADFLDAKPNILTTNASLNLPMEEGNGVVIKTGDPKAHNAFLSSQPSGYDMVFTTYNQMQTIKGEDTARRKYLSNLAGRPNGIVMIFDESHNAGGNKAKGKGGKEEATGRAGFSRELIQKANGVFYSSATYAKRPDVMDLYAATDMSMAVDDIGDLAEAISKGRVPMQQAVASMLARAGQYMRRERSFAGINYNTPAVNVDRQNYDNISKALAAIQDLSSYAKAAAKQITKELRASGEMVGADGATGDAGAKSTNFTAIMHNVINQMLLAMKAPEAAKRAIEAIKRGEKPVLTVANTMEAFLQDYSDQLEIKPGDEMPGDFSHVLRKYLDRTRTISIRKPFMAKGEKAIKHRLTDEELGFGGVAVYDRAMGIIDSMDLSGLPLSPIDFIKGELKKAGYETGEITGRTLAVDYTGKVPMLATRSGSEKTARGRAESIRKFNTKPKKGGVHAMIINQAGSTGLSLHASEKFDDQSRRRMLIVQPEGNIDTHMQLLGRINRTGQVVLPEYDQLVADIPAEKRPAAVLAKKMASLNANTTASRSSAVTAKDVPDFLNEYGDKIAAQWVSDNHDLHYRMASPVKISEEGKIDADDAMRALTGRLPLLQLAEQEAIYEELEGAYKSLIDQLEAAGENALEAKSLDLKGRLIEYMEVQGKRNDSGSPFAAPVVMQKVSIARLGKPFTPGQLLGKLAHAMDPEIKEQEDKAPIDMLANQLAAYDDPYNILGKKVLEREQAERSEAVKRFADYSRSIVDEEEDAEKQVKKKAEHLAVKDRFETIHQLVPIGKRVVLKTDTNNLSAIVLDVKQSGTPKNPLALGSWKVTFAIADASRQMVLPFSRLYPNGASNPDSALDVEVEPMTKWYEPYQATLERFQHMQNEAREERWIAGGNILAAYDWLNMKGAIINYTSYKGTVHQGILTARGFDPRKQAVEHGEIVRDAAKIKAALDDNPGHTRLYTKDGNLSIIRASRWQDQYTIAAEKSKAKGGAYFLDNDLTRIVGDFQSKGGMMLAYVNPDKLAAAIGRIADISGGGFKMAAKNLEVTKVKPNEAVEPTETDGDDGPALAMVRPTGDLSLPPHDVNRLKALVTQAVEKMVGKAVSVEFSDTAMDLPADSAAKWGDAGTKAVALYFPRLKLIEFALDSNLETNIPHEAYHASEYQLQTPVERELMQRETPRIRQLIRPYVKDKYRFGDAQIDKLADEEVRAIGMEAFMEGRLGGAHIGVRRWYQKLLDMLRRLANAIRGLGFQTAEDVYNALRSGEHAGRQEITPRPEASGPLAAIRPGGARPGPQPQNETIAEQLMNSGHDMLAGMSKKIGVGKFNTTEFRTKMQDKFIRIKRAEDSVGGVPSSLSAYQAESLYYGRTGERLERLQEDHIEPLLEAMHNADITPGELNEVLYALHAPARNAYIDTINPGLNGEGSGMSDAEAARILRSVPQNKRAELRAIIAMVRRMQSQTLDTLVAYGLISQDTADSWATQYPDGSYVPLRGFAEGSEDEELVGRGRGYDTRGKESKPAFGRKSEADGPLQYIIQQAMSAIVRGEKNRVSNTLYRFLRAHPDPDRWQINAPTIKRRIDARTGLVTHYADFNYHNEPDAVVTKIGGKPMVMRFYGKDGMNIARAVKQMGTSNLSGIMALLHTLTTLQSRLATQWNPNFMVPNFARDLGEAYINMQEQDQQHFIRQFTKHLMPAMKGAFQALNGAPNGSSPYVDAFREFDRAGGRVRFFGLSNPDDIKGKINSTMRRLQNGGFAKIENMALAVGHAFEVVNGSIENATRLAAYMAARDVGMTVPNSANLALNLTVNFTKRGEWGQGINALYMFGNASLQGTARLGRALQHERVRKAVYTLIAMGAAGALWNLMAGGDDDDGTPYYSKIKPYIRDKNLILMFPKGMGMDGKYIKVPLPYGFSPFHVLGDRAMGLVVGKEKFGQAAHSVLTSIADAFNPVGEESSLWMMMVPSVARPGFHIAFNKNWTGNPLYPEHDYDKHRPDSAKAFRSTSDFSKWGAKKLNELTGGSNYKAGWIDVHPGSLDHVIESVTGGLGKFVMDAAKTGYSVYKGDGFDATKAPIVRRFYGSAKDPIADAQAYYEARDEASKGGGQNLAAARKDASSGRNVESAREYLRENPKAAQGSEIFKRADEAMKPLRARLDRIEQDEQLTGEQKRRQRDEVVEQMRKVQNTARKRYRELKEGATP